VLLLVVLMAAGNVLLLRQVSNLRATAVHPSEMRLIRLKGTDAAPLASGYMIAFPGERDGSLTVDDVPALDAYHQYQVWLIDDGKRTSGGVFSVNDQGYGVLLITAEYPLDSYDGFGITIEPTGGSPGPTGKKVLGTDT
jgi:anti-sigma-K factor RskA